MFKKVLGFCIPVFPARAYRCAHVSLCALIARGSVCALVWYSTTAAEEIAGWIFIQQRCVV